MTLRPSAQSVSRYRFAAAYAAVRPIRRTRAASSIVKKLGRAITPPTPETSSRAATGRGGRHTTHPTPRNQLPCRESVLQQIEWHAGAQDRTTRSRRSEERRGGKEGVNTCSSRRSRYH